MAADLANTPVTGRRVQACGDCHLLNFGAYATPERRLVFDINDLDETLPAPWEWDVKRLAARFVLACRNNGFSKGDGAGVFFGGRLAEAITTNAVRQYQLHWRAQRAEAATINRETQALHRMLRLAFERGHLVRVAIFPTRLQENPPRHDD